LLTLLAGIACLVMGALGAPMVTYAVNEGPAFAVMSNDVIQLPDGSTRWNGCGYHGSC